MAYDLRVIPISEFMRTDVSGEVDLNASRELLSGLMAICEREKIDRILIEGREALHRPPYWIFGCSRKSWVLLESVADIGWQS